MIPYRFLVYLLLLPLAGCYRNDDPTATQQPTRRCLPTSMSQEINNGGQLTNPIRHEFTYTGTQINGLKLTTSLGSQPFSITYVDGQLRQLSDGNTTLTVGTGGQPGRPNRILVSQGGAQQAAYTFTYGTNGRLTSLREVRTVLPPDWYIPERTFTFTYDTAGDLIQEQVSNTFSDGATITQVTAYTNSAMPSPLVDVTDPCVLTVFGLYYRFDALPARFWQPTAPIRYETSAVGTNAGTLLTRGVFTPHINADQRIDSQDIVVTTYPAGGQFPQQRNLRQTFSYLCL